VCLDCNRDLQLAYVERRGRAEVNLATRAAKRGITVAQYKAMLKKQKGRCAICEKKRKLDIDHCHQTEEVRGLLCGPCNRGLGFFDDDVAVMRSAIKYLERTHAMPENEADDPAGISDELKVELNGVDTSVEVKGPDPDHWGADQLIPPPDIAGEAVDYEVKGPDHDHWGTPDDRAAAEAERVAQHVAEAEANGTKRTDPGPEVVPENDAVEIASGDVADLHDVLGEASPQE
jgi:hypothetical protein